MSYLDQLKMGKGGEFWGADNQKLRGEFVLENGSNRLKLFSKNSREAHPFSEMWGRLNDGTKISLLKCIREGSGGARFDEDGVIYIESYFSHFILIGSDNFVATDKVIKNIRFSIDDGVEVFGDSSAFGLIFDAKKYLDIENKERGGDADIHDDARAVYFSGRGDIFSKETAIGVVSAWYSTSYESPKSTGVSIKADVRLSIEFREAVAFDNAINSLMDFLRFVEIAAGRPQNVLNVSVELDIADPIERASCALSVVWSLAPKRNADSEMMPPSVHDMPFRPYKNRTQFENLLNNWLALNSERRLSRVRYSNSLSKQLIYDIDRLVGSANMFDILPDEIFTETETVSDEMKEAKNKAKELFRKLPDSSDRSSILGALGRIGKLTLKKKVRSRVAVFVSRVGSILPDIEYVVDHAVDCRNYHVHGSLPKLIYESGESPLSFFTDTLEFIFVVADLIDAGWHPSSYLNENRVGAHFFGQYVFNYDNNLRQLKRLEAR